MGSRTRTAMASAAPLMVVMHGTGYVTALRQPHRRHRPPALLGVNLQQAPDADGIAHPGIAEGPHQRV